jgi:ABC-type bacteriocin/lantibiotic exporter with double-glycine peptidase domain
MIRSRWSLVLTILLVPSLGWAEVPIAVASRVSNRPPGRCGWCALETLARHHGLKSMYGLTEQHPCTCCPRSLEESLASAGIRYRIQYPGCHNDEILRYAIRENLGAAVGFREPHAGAEKHIVTLVELRGDVVKVIDPNDSDGRTRQMSFARFQRLWDGFALVLEPDVV